MQTGRSLVLAALLLTGCDFPRDAAGTLERIGADGVVRVGVDERQPWVVIDGARPGGIEPRLVTAWAETLDARVEWIEGTETSLVEVLRAGKLDVMVAGLTDKAPWAHKLGTSEPFHEAAIVIGVRPGLDAPSEAEGWRGRTVAYPAERPDFAAFIEQIGALPQPATDLAGAPAVAAYLFELPGLGLDATGVVLARERHVMITAPGENALLLSLDRFLAGARESGAVVEGRR